MSFDKAGLSEWIKQNIETRILNYIIIYGHTIKSKSFSLGAYIQKVWVI